MATDRLALYNIACFALGETRLANLNEEREPRRLLDEVWTRGAGAIRYWLEQGLWNHAIRTVQTDASTSVSPTFGLTYAFDKPSDFVRLVQLSASEYFSDPLTNYEIEANYFYAEVDPLYMRYVSDDGDFGNDLSLWPETFTLWGGTWMGLQIGKGLLNDKDYKDLKLDTKRLLIDARSKDAQQEPTRFPPYGSWVRARHGSRGGGRDRGSRSQLIG